MTNQLQVGDVFVAQQGMAVYAEIPAYFVYGNVDINYGIKKHEVLVGQKFSKAGHSLDLSYLKGAYVVEHARMEGGGTGHGPGDVYPDGWHVRARKLADDGCYDPLGVMISFFQSGCFSVVNKEIPVVSRMERTVNFTPA